MRKLLLSLALVATSTTANAGYYQHLIDNNPSYSRDEIEEYYLDYCVTQVTTVTKTIPVKNVGLYRLTLANPDFKKKMMKETKHTYSLSDPELTEVVEYAIKFLKAVENTAFDSEGNRRSPAQIRSVAELQCGNLAFDDILLEGAQ